MSNAVIAITARWHSIWYSPYWRGEITRADLGLERVFKHSGSGQIRIYSANDFDGRAVSVNGGTRVTMRKRGRFGKLYISE